MTIEKLLQKYYTPEGKNLTATEKRTKKEQTTTKYNKKRKQEHNQRKRQAILTQIIQELPFTLHKDRITQIRYWINTFNPTFKDFHRQATDETIILALILIQRKQQNKRIRIEDYTITQKYNLTTPIFINIQNELIFKLMQTTPLTYNQKIVLDNSIEDKKPK